MGDDRTVMTIHDGQPASGRYRRDWTIPCLVALALLPGCESPEPRKKEVPEVVVVDVEQRDVPIHADWIGTTEGYNNATIRPQVRGYLLAIDYPQGTLVKSGQSLFRIDPREFQAQVNSAKGQLGEAKANLAKSKTHVTRYKPLAKEGAISEQELDDAVQNMLAAEASLLTAQAHVEQAELNLAWTTIASPIQGVAGISKAQVGDLVTPETPLATVSQLDPIKVNFPISEKAYLEVVRNTGGSSAEGRLASAGPILELFLADESAWPERGTPFVLGRNVDARTGTIVIEGRFPNPHNVLRPGQFARVRIHVGNRDNALLIPQRAVEEIQGKFLVAVVSQEDVVDVRAVEVGDTVGTDWIISKGIEAGERVVVEGLQKVRTGMKVKTRTKKSDPAEKVRTRQPEPSRSIGCPAEIRIA